MLLPFGELAEALGVSIATLRHWDRSDALKPACRTVGGPWRYDLQAALRTLGTPGAQEAGPGPPKSAVGYARVSSHDQKDDLERQNLRLAQALQGESESIVIADLGSGLNFKKRGLTKLLDLILTGRVGKLYVTHKDRLLRFGFELVEQLVRAHGGQICVLEDVAVNDDAELAMDVLTIITVFSARLYGRRGQQRRRQAA